MKKTKVKKQKTLKKQGCSLFLLLMLLALAPVVLATVILSTTSLRLTRTNLEGSVQTTLHVTADNLAKYCKENEITAMNASGYYEYLDSLKEEDLEMAILADGIRLPHPLKMKMTIVSVKSPWIRILCPPVGRRDIMIKM